METGEVLAAAAAAKAAGSGRFCMGAAWREPKDRDLDALCEMVSGVKALGLETCMTLGMLTQGQADRLAAAGLDYYNHNLDTLTRILWRDHPHPLLPGPAGYARPCPPVGHGGVLRRHRRYG